ncbi:MAG TPA: homoserine dehydrogenase [Ohtaekwangia sp.]|nr:homoserine dehydrogenase [Ohtaekwangia sp.]
MKNLKRRLLALDKEIQIAIVGIGSIGKGLVYQVNATPGMKPVAIADIHLNKAIECAKWLGLDYEIVDTVERLNAVIEKGKLAISDNGELLASSHRVDVFVESSSAILQGAVHAMTAIKNHQHVVMMNFEAEMMYGPLLLQRANEEGVVYTCADGDQPTAIKKLIDDIDLWGFDLVMAGNIKGYMDRYTNPTKIIPEADKRSLDHKMCSSYTDGTKLCVEMAVLANAINGKAAVPGMYGHQIARANDIFKAYNFEEIWKDRVPVVDYLLGAEPKGGVFVIGYTENKFQQYTLEWFPPDMGPGPFYVFYRPYHLGHIEAMECIAEAYFEGTARLQPSYGMKTNVFAYAKTDLKQGDVIDGMGGYKSYGLIENLADNVSSPGLPICISDHVKLKRDIPKDGRIGLNDVVYDPNDLTFKLYFEALKVNLSESEKAADVVRVKSNLQLV